MPTKITETISRTSSVETVEKTRWEKGWETRRKNKIAAQKAQLSNSIPSSAHKQWMTKKDNEIADLKQQLAEQKSKKQQQSEDILQEVENELKNIGF